MDSKVLNILDVFKNKIIEIYDNRLSRLILFGSQARGDDVDGSDIDVMIVLNDDEVNPIKEIDIITDFLADISLEFNRVVSCVFMSEKRFQNEKSPLILNVKREGKVL